MINEIAILTDIYYPHPMAGGICAHQLAKALLKKGHTVHIICLRRKDEPSEETIDGIQVHRIKMPIVYKIRDLSERIVEPKVAKMVYNFAIILNRLFKVLLIHWYPMMSPAQIISYIRCVKRLPVDTVIGTYFSIESAYAATVLKQKYGKKMIIYNLDSLSNSDPVTGLSHSYVRKKGEKWEKRLFTSADGIIIMKSHETHYNSVVFKKFMSKIQVSDLPLMEIKNKICATSVIEKNGDNSNIKWLYTGSLSHSTRNPDYILELFNALEFAIEFDFFSKGDCEETIRSFKPQKGKKIIQHGHVAKNILEEYYAKADFLISIGNASGVFLPSKTIEYIAHLKPIIHICYQEQDASLKYLEKYEHALIIRVYDTCFEENIEQIKIFITKYMNNHIAINADEVEKKFEENTPEYTANLIENILV